MGLELARGWFNRPTQGPFDAVRRRRGRWWSRRDRSVPSPRTVERDDATTAPGPQPGTETVEMSPAQRQPPAQRRNVA
jgi:hypothetical protein